MAIFIYISIYKYIWLYLHRNIKSLMKETNRVRRKWDLLTLGDRIAFQRK